MLLRPREVTLCGWLHSASSCAEELTSWLVPRCSVSRCAVSAVCQEVEWWEENYWMASSNKICVTAALKYQTNLKDVQMKSEVNGFEVKCYP